MSPSAILTVVEHCRVSPSRVSTPPSPASLPLTFFDILWLLCSRLSQPLFFYHLPTTTAHFTNAILPTLKHSLSLALTHFFPLAGKLLVLPPPANPHIEFTDGDSVSLSIAEAAVDGAGFEIIASDCPRGAGVYHDLVPTLLGGALLAVQITVFPGSGISMGFTFRNVAADWRTFDNFLRAWATFYQNGDVNWPVAFLDRSVIKEDNRYCPSGLKSALLRDWWEIESKCGISGRANSLSLDMVRATLVLGPKEMDGIREWIHTRSEKLFGPVGPLLLSPYVVTCAFLWTCWMQTHYWDDRFEQEVQHYFGFIAGGITRLSYSVPRSYVGNCVGFGRASATRKQLTGENGIVYAAKAIGGTIKKLNCDFLGGAENWISEWEALHGSGLHLMVIGSPKVGLYWLDFGWGRPVKFEEVTIDCMSAISLSESRKVDGGIEVGVAFTRSKMDDFCELFNKGLIDYSNVNMDS